MSKLDINRATKEEIDALPGWQGRGHELVRYREERGGFTSLRELEEVPGLTGKVTDEIRARLTIGG